MNSNDPCQGKFHRALVAIGDSRSMKELEPDSIDLVVTSPPYWQIKDYGCEHQIGYEQNLHEYLADLYMVWKECYRVIRPGRRLCINIGDQFARASLYGRYRIIPLFSECVLQCESIGFDYMGSIIWQKKTTMNTSGGASVMGSYPYPPNGIVEIDYEYIALFKKPGRSGKPNRDIKEQSQLSKEEWKDYFSGHWRLAGVKKSDHQAAFPEEIPSRLIKMFSFRDDTVLDPFLGSGTTAKTALELERKTVGYEINPDFLPAIKRKIQSLKRAGGEGVDIKIIRQKADRCEKPAVADYCPVIRNANRIDNKSVPNKQSILTFKTVSIEGPDTLLLDDGRMVGLLGISVKNEKIQEALEYLKKYVLKKEVFLKFDRKHGQENRRSVLAYVYLKNRIFINMQFIVQGFAEVNNLIDFEMKQKFINNSIGDYSP